MASNTKGNTFQRRKENFCCEFCGYAVQGDGYTNHCSQCLYSKHVDIYPGDRQAGCGGLMEPVFLEKVSGEEKLTHHCLRCGFIRKNKVDTEDSFDALLALTRQMTKKI